MVGCRETHWRRALSTVRAARLAYALILVTSIASAGAPPAVEDNRREVAGGEHRELGGHHFVTPQNVRGAFNNAYFAFAQGFGLERFEIEALGTTSKLFLYYQQFGGQFDILNWASIELTAQGFAAVAGTLDDILALGAIANVNASAFIRARFFTLDSIGLQMSGGVGLGYSRSFNMRPSVLVGKALGEVVEDALVTSYSSFVASPTLMLAYGYKAFGAQLSVGASIAKGLDHEKETSYSLQPGLHLTFDVAHFTEYFPVSIVAEYVPDIGLNGEKTLAHLIGAGLQYSGRRDVNMGVLMGYQTSSQTGASTSLIYGSLNIQYFF